MSTVTTIAACFKGADPNSTNNTVDVVTEIAVDDRLFADGFDPALR